MHCNINLVDLESRLDGTVCLYDDYPYYIRAARGSPQIHLRKMTSHRDDFKIIRFDDPLFDVATPPLGYVQVMPKRVLYATRRPHRRWKQGITAEGLYIEWHSSAVPYHFMTEPFEQTMAKKFYSLAKAKELIGADKNYGEFAISNDCCLINQGDVIKVYFRFEEVGFISRPGLSKARPTVVVPSSKKGWIISKYLQEFAFDVK